MQRLMRLKQMIRARYSRMMEEGFFRNKPADYVWLMVFSASVLLVISVSIDYCCTCHVTQKKKNIT